MDASANWRMVAAMVLSGTIGALVVASGQTPWTVVLFRCLIGGPALLAWLAWQGGWKPMAAHDVGWLLLGGAALVINWLCLFSAYRASSISIATVVYHMQPFILVGIAALGGEKPQRGKLPWLVLAFMGVVLTAGLESGGNVLAGVGLALAAAFFYAVATLATRRLQAFAPSQVAGLQLLMGVVAMAPFANLDVAGFSQQTWACLAILGLVHTGLMYQLMYYAFQRLRADVLATLAFIYPVVAIVVDLLVFKTSLAPLQMLGMGAILAAVVANQRVR